MKKGVDRADGNILLIDIWPHGIVVRRYHTGRRNTGQRNHYEKAPTCRFRNGREKRHLLEHYQYDPNIISYMSYDHSHPGCDFRRRPNLYEYLPSCIRPGESNIRIEMYDYNHLSSIQTCQYYPKRGLFHHSSGNISRSGYAYGHNMYQRLVQPQFDTDRIGLKAVNSF